MNRCRRHRPRRNHAVFYALRRWRLMKAVREIKAKFGDAAIKKASEV